MCFVGLLCRRRLVDQIMPEPTATVHTPSVCDKQRYVSASLDELANNAKFSAEMSTVEVCRYTIRCDNHAVIALIRECTRLGADCESEPISVLLYQFPDVYFWEGSGLTWCYFTKNGVVKQKRNVVLIIVKILNKACIKI